MRKRIEKQDKEYFEKLYSSKRRLKNRVLWHEGFVAFAVAEYLQLRHLKPKRKPRLSSDLEWLLTWKLKTGICPQIMWCDGVQHLKIKRLNKYKIGLKSEVWIGPENGSGNTTLGTMHGEIEVKHTGKALKSYSINIEHENNKYQAKKA